MQDESPEEWEDACAFDEAIRKTGGPMGDCYVHGSYRPLRTAPIKDDRNQGLLFPDGDNVCDGMCGL